MGEIEGASEKFLKNQEQRDKESIIQFVNLVDPKDAAKLVAGAHEANEIIHHLKTDTLIISQRGGSVFDWIMKRFDLLLDRKSIKTIYLPLGTQRDITTDKKRKTTEPAEKAAIAKEVISKSSEVIDNFGNITFIDEAQSGASISIFLEYILPIIKEYKFNSFHVIAMVDEGSTTSKNKAIFENLREKYNVEIDEILTSLATSDNESFLETLAHNPNSESIVPEQIDNERIKAMIELMTIGALYTHELLNLVNGQHPNDDLLEAYQTATKGLSQPEYIHQWLQSYCQELILLDNRNSELEQ